MKFENIHHIYFDLDHTLWDFDRNSALTFEVILKQEKIDIDLTEFLEVYVPINSNYWELYRNGQISKESLRTGRLKDSFDKLKLQVHPEIIDNLSVKYLEFLPQHNHLLDDTLEILEYLKPNYQLHIITNGFEEIQNDKLRNSNIANFFETITTSEEAGVKKPHSKIFELALDKAAAIPENSLMIGDNFEADILGAKNAGMQILYFDYYQKQEVLDCPQIQKLKELERYL